MRNRSISERKEAQETVRATEQHVRLLVEATRAIPWEASAETFQFTYVGPQVVKLFGYPLERWYEDHFWISHIHPADRDDAVEFCLKSSQSFENYEFEYRMIASDEKTVWIHDIVNVVSHDGVPKTHRGFLIDISERKREQEVLQNSKEQLRLITDSLPVCISYVDAEQRYQFNNKTYESWFGLSRSELKGRHLKEVLGASAYETIQGPAEEALSGRAVTFETVLPYIGAGERHVLANFVPDVADRGKVKGFFVLVTDITERNRIEKALRQSEAALRQSQKSLRGLAGRLLSAQEDERRRIAQELHDDVNQRMAAVVIGIGTLEQQLAKSDRPIGKTLAQLRGQAEDLSDQIRQFAHRLHPSILDHLGLVAALKSLCEEFGQQTGVRITFRHRNVPSELPSELARCLYRVAQESLTNVAKHSGAKRASLSLTGTRDLLRLAVTDRGTGFDPEILGNNLGIGMISMEERVGVLSGRLFVESHLGGGTRVEAHLPLLHNNT